VKGLNCPFVLFLIEVIKRPKPACAISKKGTLFDETIARMFLNEPVERRMLKFPNPIGSGKPGEVSVAGSGRHKLGIPFPGELVAESVGIVIGWKVGGVDEGEMSFKNISLLRVAETAVGLCIRENKGYELIQAFALPTVCHSHGRGNISL